MVLKFSANVAQKERIIFKEKKMITCTILIEYRISEVVSFFYWTAYKKKYE